jgi:hypothetical protein
MIILLELALPAWGLPSGLRNDLSGAPLISKEGAAIAGCLATFTGLSPCRLGDRLLSSAPHQCVLKSRLAVGLQPGQAEAATLQDPDWLVDGKWGQIQFLYRSQAESSPGDL